MRPQQNAAENIIDTIFLYLMKMSFNEAAAKRCGKQQGEGNVLTRSMGFNEAAAKRCGKHQNDQLLLHDNRASMRPQQNAAENSPP